MIKKKTFKSSNGIKMISGHRYNWQVDSPEYLRLCFVANSDFMDEDYYWGEDPVVVFNIVKNYLDTGILHHCHSFKDADAFVDKVVKAYKGKFVVAPLFIKKEVNMKEELRKSKRKFQSWFQGLKRARPGYFTPGRKFKLTWAGHDVDIKVDENGKVTTKFVS